MRWGVATRGVPFARGTLPSICRRGYCLAPGVWESSNFWRDESIRRDTLEHIGKELGIKEVSVAQIQFTTINVNSPQIGTRFLGRR